MNIKRFFATSSREVLNMVRNELGADAVIVSNRSTDGGNEILAVRGSDMDNLISNKAPQEAKSVSQNLQESLINERVVNKPVINDQVIEADVRSLESKKTEEMIALLTTKRSPVNTVKTQSSLNNQITNRGMTNQATGLIDSKSVNLHLTKQAPQPQASKPDEATAQRTQEMHSVMQEIRNIRADIDTQLSEISWLNQQQREPAKKTLLKTMLNAGFSAGLARYIVEKMPNNMPEKEAIAWAKNILANNIKTAADESEILDQGGVFALVGPTGVGKTTTTAKLAAKFVMKHGTSKLALITTDAYRIGGHEQLRIYGKILGVMVHAVKDEADLKIALEELKQKHTILIDTVGVSQRDRMVAQQIAMLSNNNSQIKKILCLNATNTIETLTDVVNAYRGNSANGTGLDGCIITKIDEAATIGNALDVVIQQKLKMYYLTNGQRVPEDIHLANKNWLVHHAFNAKSALNKQSQFNDDELGFVIANQARMNNPAGLELNHV